MIVFQTVRWKNFLGTGNNFIEIKLNESPNMLFAGENGAGKSTILDAICFSLFNRGYREINKPLLVNSINKKNCLVEIEFTANNKNYKIIRGIKPNVFEIHCDGICINQDSSTDYQDYLEKFILRMNFKSFTQIVILGSASFKPFMKLKPAERREVIEDVLDIQVFSVMNTIVKQRMTRNKESFDQNRIALVAKQDKQSFVQKTIDNLKKNNENKLNELTLESDSIYQDIERLEFEINALEKEYDAIVVEASKISALKTSHNSYLTLHAKIDTKMRTCNHDINFFESNDDCPTCCQKIDEGFKNEMMQKSKAKLAEYEDAIGKIEKNLSDIVEKIKRIDALLKDANKIQNTIASKKTKKITLEKNVRDIEHRMSQIQNSDTMLIDAQEELSHVNTELKTLIEEKQKLLEERTYIETALNLLKDGGVKTRIIRQYLPIINKMINKYLLQMGYLINFELDENFDETIKSRYRDEFVYNSFSEGQKFRIDLAILFAWRAVSKLKNSVNTNLLIFDEIFERPLDANGKDEFVKMLYDLIKDTNVIIITPNADQLSDKFKKVIRFEQKQNFTRIV